MKLNKTEKEIMEYLEHLNSYTALMAGKKGARHMNACCSLLRKGLVKDAVKNNETLDNGVVVTKLTVRKA